MAPMRSCRAPAVLLLLAACATTSAPPVPTTRTVAAPEGQVRDRIAAALRDLGLPPEPTRSGVQAVARGSASRDWADCRLALISSYQDDAPRHQWESPGARQARIEVSLAPAGSGTRVSVEPRFSATYRDPFRNLPVERGCASTGALERRLLDAAGG
jgi:hypothetical protein